MHVLLATLVVVSLAGPVRIADRLAADGPTETTPDGLSMPSPLGDVLGPHGHIGSVPAPGGAVAADAALPPAGGPEKPAERRKQRIDDLFARLASAKDEPEAQAVGALLNRLWLQSGSDTADLLMQRAISAMDAKNTAVASSLLDKIILLRPDWAEAWNKRATVRYLDDDDAASMEDISHVLALEPRHFGALSGMGFILHRNGQDKAALQVLRKAAAVNPQNTDVKGLIETLTPDVEGRDL